MPNFIQQELAPTSTSRAVPSHPVDVIVPVYRGLADTIVCISSVLQSNCTVDWQLIIINDCSPEPELTAWLRNLAVHDPRVSLLENQDNLGFVATVNRGMAVNTTHDVLLLNSDAEVSHDWLDRIQRAAYSEPRVASVTPFSNNATICSYPRFCEDNALPTNYSTAELDTLFKCCLNGQTVHIPTAVGFCMYVRRQCLDEIGLFDVAHFGKGYGEENDFCMRATAAGWLHLHALDTFVRHAGGISFGNSANARQDAALQTLRQLHPGYEAAIKAHVLQDPARSARLRIDMARLSPPDTCRSKNVAPYVLHIVPANGGGVDRYVRDICSERPQDCILHVVNDQAVFEFVAAARFFPIDVAVLRSPAFQDALGLPVCLHAHSTLNPVRSVVQWLSESLSTGYVLTLHDTDFSDTSDYVSQPERLARQTFVTHAAARIVPSRYIGGLARLAAGGPFNCQLIENGVSPRPTSIAPPNLPSPAGICQVAVIGALGPGKGLYFLEDVACALPLDIRIVIFGYVDGRLLPGWLIPDRVWMHGAFEPNQLSALVHQYTVKMAFFPNLRPESYCYALSDAWTANLPALGPAAGAIGERLAQSGAGWTFDQNSNAREVADTIASCLRAVEQPLERVRFAVDQLTSRQEMVTALNQHYKTLRQDAWRSPNLPAIELLAATHLDGALFRTELQKLAGDLSFAQAQTERLNESLQVLSAEHEARGTWIAKLQDGINELQGEIHRVESERIREQHEYREHRERVKCSFKNAFRMTIAPIFRFRHWLADLMGNTHGRHTK